MTETQQAATRVADRGTSAPTPRGEEQTASGWLAWVVFAAVMMGMVGLFQALAGLVAIFDRNYYAVSKQGLVLSWNYTAWGWIHLALGVLVVAAAFGVLAGKRWARVVAIALASLSAVANLLFLAAEPFWSTLIIAFDVLVIYALVVHGEETEQ